MVTLTDKYREQIKGSISCYDRILIAGTLPHLCYADGTTKYLTSRGIRIFDYAAFAEPLRDQIRHNAESMAKEHGLGIAFVRKSSERKEELVAQKIAERGGHPGLVCILSAMERCPTYKPWHDKKTGRTYLKGDEAKCLHYYFYFIDEELGRCFVRVPTWCPFTLQFYFNGHNWLAAQLGKQGIGYRMQDNAFADIADFRRAQEIANGLHVPPIHDRLDLLARKCCPVIVGLGESHHWSLSQVEYATDIIFKSAADLCPLYQSLIRTAVLAVKSENVSMFLGRKLVGQYKDELGS